MKSPLLQGSHALISPSPSYSHFLSPSLSLSLSLVITLTLSACDDEDTKSAPMAGAGAQAGEAGVTAGERSGEPAGEPAGVDAGTAAQGCVPSEEGRAQASAFLEGSCGLCHGATPQYGAPNSFSDLDALLAGEEGSRPIDRVIARLVEGSMPPTGQPQPTEASAQALIDWASCGEGPQRLTPPGGFEVSRPRYPSAGAPPAGAEVKALLASSAEVSATINDQYQCFLFTGPGEAGEERGIVRFEPVIDEARVVHHIVLYEAPDVTPTVEGEPTSCGAGLGAAVYAWAPGQGALHFTEGALVTGGDKRYLLEIHYNNEAGYEGVRDSSGVRLYHTPPHTKRIDMMTLGPDNFTLAPRSRTELGSLCEIQEELELVALMPHMHELGVNLHSEVLRAGVADEPEAWEDIINLKGWDFNFQLAYDAQGQRLSPGDTVKTTCLFENTSSEERRFGPFTEDEMCYHFVYVTPPPAERRCHTPLIEQELTYEPGECAPANAQALGQSVQGSYRAGQPPAAEGGALPTGRFSLAEVQLWFSDFDTGVVVIDPEQSFYVGAGSLELSAEGQLALDMRGTVNITSAQGAQFSLPINVSFGGLFEEVSAEAGEPSTSARLTPSCPESAPARPIAYSATPTSLTLLLPFNQPVEGVQLMRYELAAE